MKRVGVYDAKTHLPGLLEQVERGETIEITRHGRPIARLVPLAARQRDLPATLQAIRAFRKGKRLEGVSPQELIDEGRRF